MFNKKSHIELKKDLEQESFNRITCSFYRYVDIMNTEKFRNRLYQEFSYLNILSPISYGCRQSKVSLEYKRKNNTENDFAVVFMFFLINE